MDVKALEKEYTSLATLKMALENHRTAYSLLGQMSSVDPLAEEAMAEEEHQIAMLEMDISRRTLQMTKEFLIPGNPVICEVLTRRYLLDQKWAKLAKELDISRRHAYRLKDIGLNRILEARSSQEKVS